MAKALDPNKAKTARRVIEVLEFFSEENRQATVMDIVRRYKRPQSSTSELLASLVELGLLYKDPATKSYTLTPRAAILGTPSQSPIVREGRLMRLADQLQSRTGLGVAVLGMVGLNAQVFLWKPPGKTARSATLPSNGAQERLCDTAAGWLLLSSLPHQRADGVLRRLNAEAPQDHKFNHLEVSERVKDCARMEFAQGPAGFGANAAMSAVLLRGEPSDRPMAVALVYEAAASVRQSELVDVLRDAVASCVGEAANVSSAVPNAA